MTLCESKQNRISENGVEYHVTISAAEFEQGIRDKLIHSTEAEGEKKE